MEIAPLDEDSFSDALPLGRAWDYDEAEFQRLVTWTDGCGRLAYVDDGCVGMALGFPWEPVGWIGDVLVLEDHRGQGIGEQVTQATVDALQGYGCTTVKLYATPKAVGLYRRMGFQGEAEYVVAAGTHKRGRDPAVEPLGDHLEAAVALDAQVFPGDRARLLRDQVEDHPEVSVATVDRGGLTGFASARVGDEVTEVGPVVVADAEAGVAQALVDAVLTRVPEGRVEVTYPANGWAAETSWSCRGFVGIDHPLEMRLGPPVEEARGSIVAAGGQELG